MKKNVIALMLAVVIASGSIGTVPALASETVEQEAVEAEEQTEEETVEVTEDESVEVTEDETAEIENAATGETVEGAAEGESVVEIAEEPEQDLAEEIDIADTAEIAQEIEPSVVDETVTEDEQISEEVADEEIEDTEQVDKEAKGTIVKTGTCGENLTWTFDNEGVLTISGSGDMTDYAQFDKRPWDSLTIKKVIIQYGVTSIGDYAFRRFSQITSVTMSSSLRRIGVCAFSGCINIQRISIPYGVTSIGGNAFELCRNLTNVTIPNSVTSIGQQAFWICDSLTSIVIPNSVTSVGYGAFEKCEALNSATISNNISSIEKDLFNGCSNLGSITIPASASYIGNNAFDDCKNLRNLTIQNGATSIGQEAFENCDSLTSVIIPKSVNSIGHSGFNHCDNLKNVIIHNGVKSIANMAFDSAPYLKDIYYIGTQNEWLSINITNFNELLQKNIIFVEDPYNLKYASVTGLTNKTFTGKPIIPALNVNQFGVTLKSGVDYTVSCSNNTYPGTATVKITGIGSYKGSITKSFTIKKAPNTITAKSFTKTYSTKAQSFSLGVKIKNGTPTYKSSTKYVTVSKAGTVTVKAKYIGKATITITAPEKTNYSKQTKKITITVNPTKTALSSVSSPSAGKMTVKWKKNAVGSGYQIQYSTSKGKKYYVRIRTKKVVGSAKFFSAWSAAKTVTIKK